MPTFRKKPVQIEASQWFTVGDHPSVALLRDPQTQADIPFPDTGGSLNCSKDGRLYTEHGWIDTLEGGHIVCPGDWIATGVQGKQYPIKPDIFAATYDSTESADELARDVDLVHNLMLGGFADDVDPLDHLGVEGDVITLKALGRVLRITVARS